MTDHELTHAIIGAAIDVHRALGPRPLEAVYEECLAREFDLRGISYQRQKPVPLVYQDLKLEPIMLTYLRLSGCKLGLAINSHVRVLKEGIRRYVWHYQPATEKDDAEAQRTRESQRKNDHNGSRSGIR